MAAAFACDDLSVCLGGSDAATSFDEDYSLELLSETIERWRDEFRIGFWRCCSGFV